MARRKNEPTDIYNYIKVGGEDECWPWMGGSGGTHNDRGYFQYGGKKWLAYRFIYALVYGPFPDDKVVRHKCNNSLCCNHKHLTLGTRSDNEHDKYLTDTSGLPVAAVREIKRLLQTTNATQQTIADYVSKRYNYNVSRSAVRNIKLGLRRNRIDEAKTAGEIAGFALQFEDSIGSSDGSSEEGDLATEEDD